MRDRMNVYFPPELLKQIAELADRKKLSRSAIVETAVASFLSPDGGDRREAAFARRLDRLSRQMQRLERDVGLTAETLALFIRFWLTITPPLPNDAQAANPRHTSSGCSVRWQYRCQSQVPAAEMIEPATIPAVMHASRRPINGARTLSGTRSPSQDHNPTTANCSSNW